MQGWNFNTGGLLIFRVTSLQLCVYLPTKAVLDLRTKVFAHGQLYTVLSRVRHRDHARILFEDNKSDSMTTNVV